MSVASRRRDKGHYPSSGMIFQSRRTAYGLWHCSVVQYRMRLQNTQYTAYGHRSTLQNKQDETSYYFLVVNKKRDVLS